MISFSDVKRYINDTPAVSRFKPWWEISLDLLLAGLFLIMILSWTRSYSIEAGGIICVPIDGDAFNVATSDIRYIQSRCYMESGLKTIEFYPYVLFLQWILMFLCQISWIWIPSVINKFNYFYNIFMDILNVEPTFVFNTNNYGMLPDIDYIDENRQKLKIIHDKITFMLMEENYLNVIYKRKVLILTIVITGCIIITTLWINLLHFPQSDFSCTLQSGAIERKSFPTVACNISPYLFMYGVIILHLLILLCMLALSIKCLFWHTKIIREHNTNYDRLFCEYTDNYRGLPGYHDLSLILELFKLNVRDGKFWLTTILYVLTSKYANNRPVIVSDGIVREKPIHQRTTYSYMDEFFVVSNILNIIGCEIVHFEQNPDTLYKYLQKQIKNNIYNISSRDDNDIRKLVVYEIQSNINYYIRYAENEFSSPPDMIDSPNPYSVNQKLYDILNIHKWPDHLVLWAAANLLKTKIILITSNTTIDDDIFTHDIFAPIIPDDIQNIILLTFINPHYYYQTTILHSADITQKSNYNEFITRKRYRDRIKQDSLRRLTVYRSSNAANDKHRRVRHEKFKPSVLPIPIVNNTISSDNQVFKTIDTEVSSEQQQSLDRKDK